MMNNPNLLQLLMHLFDDSESDYDQPMMTDSDMLFDALRRIGLDRQCIEQALNWLDAFVTTDLTQFEYSENCIRIYSDEECNTISQPALAALRQLLDDHAITPAEFEFVLSQCMALNHSPISEYQLQWILDMTLVNQTLTETHFDQKTSLVNTTRH
ncbi:MAG: DUF494 family protein [Francisellaceae bacterium]